MNLAALLLAIVALYTGGAWIWVSLTYWRTRHAVSLADNAGEIRREVAAHTFHLGLCFILAVGFLGLIAG